MASTGYTAWMKYFQGKGDIKDVIVKKDSPAYDPELPNQRYANNITIKAGEKVTYLASRDYNSKPLVQYKKGSTNHLVRVSFNNLTKPGNKASRAVSLKPQSFGVMDTKKYSIQEYKKVILDHIEDRNDLSSPLKTYLEALFKFCAGDRTVSRSDLSKVYTNVKSDLPINDINKDFGEVAGAIGCYTFQLFKEKGITLPATTKIFMPSRPNEPLMDYALWVGDKQYTISAKSGTTTNTVKPPDIIQLLETGKKTKKWKDKPEYKLLQLLAESSIIAGPIKAVAATSDLIDEEKVKNVDKKTDVTIFSKFINQNEYLKKVTGKPTINEIMYECEKMLQARTKAGGDLFLNDIFSDAISEKVIYVKFEIDATGLPKWSVTMADDINVTGAKRIHLRTKNGYTRSSDRMGVQL